MQRGEWTYWTVITAAMAAVAVGMGLVPALVHAWLIEGRTEMLLVMIGMLTALLALMLSAAWVFTSPKRQQQQ